MLIEIERTPNPATRKFLPGRTVIEGDTDKNRFIDEAYTGRYIYAPQEFLEGNEFRFQVIDARKPDVIYKEIVLTADSKLIQQLRADFSVMPEFFFETIP